MIVFKNVKDLKLFEIEIYDNNIKEATYYIWWIPFTYRYNLLLAENINLVSFKNFNFINNKISSYPKSNNLAYLIFLDHPLSFNRVSHFLGEYIIMKNNVCKGRLNSNNFLNKIVGNFLLSNVDNAILGSLFFQNNTATLEIADIRKLILSNFHLYRNEMQTSCKISY